MALLDQHMPALQARSESLNWPTEHGPLSFNHWHISTLKMQLSRLLSLRNAMRSPWLYQLEEQPLQLLG